MEVRENVEPGSEVHTDALKADGGLAVEMPYREADERRFDLWVMRATSRKQMGEPKESERPDYSMFA